jgi:hypothetical protein
LHTESGHDERTNGNFSSLDGVYSGMSFSILDCWDCCMTTDYTATAAWVIVLGVVFGLVKYRLRD